MKQKTIIGEEMKDDLMRVYRDVVRNRRYHRQKDAYIETVSRSAPRFYIDPRWALQRLSPMMRGDFSGVDRLSALRRQMYIDLFHVVIGLSRKTKYVNHSLIGLVREAVLEPAPRFYITHYQMEKIWKEKTRRKSV